VDFAHFVDFVDFDL